MSSGEFIVKFDNYSDFVDCCKDLLKLKFTRIPTLQISPRNELIITVHSNQFSTMNSEYSECIIYKKYNGDIETMINIERLKE